MGTLANWLHENWFSTLQSLGIAGSLLFTAQALRHDIRAKRVSEYLTLATQHRRLWGQLYRRPGLAHVLDAERDLTKRPITLEERRYVELTVTHFNTGWLITREKTLISMKTLAVDAGQYFRLPVPAAVWKELRAIYDPEFVNFIDQAVQSINPSSERCS